MGPSDRASLVGVDLPHAHLERVVADAAAAGVLIVRHARQLRAVLVTHVIDV